MKHGVVTVFGGTGFVGRYIVRALAREGVRVRVACRRTNDALVCKPMGDVGQVVPVAANIRDDASVAAAMEGADAAVNLVGVLYGRGRQSFEAIHHDGAARIARLASDAGLRSLWSKVSAIGASPTARAAYARTKGLGEEDVKNAFPDATILRPSIIFGPEDDFFNRFAAMARLTPALPLIGGGRTRFQPVYVCDVAAAVVAALDGPAAGRTFELGGPAIYSFRELLEIMLNVIGRRRLLVPVPFWVATADAFFLEKLPYPLLTRDQVTMLKDDNVVSAGMPGLSDLGIEATALEAVLPTYLSRYRRGGRRAAAHGQPHIA